MIFVDRNAVPAPAELLAFHDREMARLKPLFEMPAETQISVSRWLESRELRDRVLISLEALFHGKCAYCERPGVSIDLFRPRQRAGRGNGGIDNKHYGWLASDWNNLYLCCRECNLRKANLFPIDGPAAAPFTSGKALAAEKPLLVDPCNDDPARHLRFGADGFVEPLSLSGEVTIKVLNLNAPSLVWQRRETARATIAQFEAGWAQFGDIADKNDFANAWLRQHASTIPHAAVVRDVLKHFLGGHTEQSTAAFPAPTLPVPPAGAMPARVASISTAVWLQRIEICNFKAITCLDQRFPSFGERNEREGQSWLMFLGENGAGKSSILQAVALALMPDAERDAYGNPARWLNKHGQAGRVCLTFSDNSQRELSFQEGDKSFTASGALPDMPVLAYGATRLLPDRERDNAREPTAVSVRNLFDPTFPLIDAERRLCDETAVSNDSFAMLVADLGRLLPAGASAPINRTKSALNSEVNGRVIPLRDLSGGYKSVLALAMDIMVHLTKSSFDMESARGLVMIDELELHLHPRWKIRIVEQLRGLFPRVQFISCTHDPLCVHGLRRGELHIIGLNPASQDFVVEQYDVPPGTRADEILTGPWFGLQSTMDAGTMELMADHSALLQLETRTEEQERSMELIYGELSLRLAPFDDIGDKRTARAARRIRPDGLSDGALTDANVAPEIKRRFNAILTGAGKTDPEDDLA